MQHPSESFSEESVHNNMQAPCERGLCACPVGVSFQRSLCAIHGGYMQPMCKVIFRGVTMQPLGLVHNSNTSAPLWGQFHASPKEAFFYGVYVYTLGLHATPLQVPSKMCHEMGLPWGKESLKFIWLIRMLQNDLHQSWVISKNCFLEVS